MERKLRQDTVLAIVNHQLRQYRDGLQTADQAIHNIDTTVGSDTSTFILGEYDPTDDMYSLDYTGGLRLPSER